MSQPTKTYAHDGELFFFELPISWSYGIETDGTQVFWHQPSGTGTLRVSSLTAQRISDAGTPASTVLNKASQVSTRPDGVAWTNYRVASSEQGEDTIIFWWELAQFIAPRYFRVALFSFTIFAHEEVEPGTRAMLERLNVLLPRTRFGALQAFERG